MPISIMLYVVGSGPAGVSAAKALLEKGLKVTMLDAGVELEQEKQEILDELSQSKQWDPEMLDKLRGEMDPSSVDGPKKLVYGSDYTYKEVENHMPVILNQVLVRPSYALGGLSTVWGSVVMPYADADIQDWPISVKDFEPFYKKVLGFMKISVAKDGSNIPGFPLYTDDYQTFELSNQARILLEKFKKNQEKLKEKGISFGSTRLAVQFQGNEKRLPCNYNGKCLYGCPYKLIYSSDFTVEEMQDDDNFEYVPNVVVERVEETNDGIIIIAHDRLTKEKKEFSGERVFIGGGTVSSTKIVLASMGAYNDPITIQDSQRFDLPCIMHKGGGDVKKEKLHTLSQLSLEVSDKNVSDNSLHLQVYTYNDLYEKTLRKMLGPLYSVLKFPLKQVLSRIILVRGYIHSNSSSSIKATLEKGSPDKMVLESNNNPDADKVLSKLVKKFLVGQKLTGLLPLPNMAKLYKPGSSNHYGGSFPMRKEPKKFESDLLGRPFGFKRIHLVDSSVFPSIASQSITLTVMANSYRIATDYDRD